VADMQVELVAVERKVWSGNASFVFARTVDGEIGILPEHEPLIAQLADSVVVRIDPDDGDSVTAAVHGGFLSVTADSVTVLAELAELADEIDVSRAREARDRSGENDDAVRRAEVRLAVAGETD